MSNQAPRSNRHVERRISRVELIPDEVFLRMRIETVVTHDERARTTVSRPVLRNALDQDPADRAVEAQLRKLPGADAGIPFAGVSQTWTVTWDGVCRPV